MGQNDPLYNVLDLLCNIDLYNNNILYCQDGHFNFTATDGHEP